MVEVQKDPMSPPRFKVNKKIPRGPPSPPAPVMHSPTRKVTVKEQQVTNQTLFLLIVN
jgi:SNW domain-containing protein 1